MFLNLKSLANTKSVPPAEKVTEEHILSTWSQTDVPLPKMGDVKRTLTVITKCPTPFLPTWLTVLLPIDVGTLLLKFRKEKKKAVGSGSYRACLLKFHPANEKRGNRHSFHWKGCTLPSNIRDGTHRLLTDGHFRTDGRRRDFPSGHE